MTEPSSSSLVTPAFVALTLSDLAYFTATGVLVAVTPVFATEALGAGPAGVGVAMGSFSATTLMLRPWAGRWSDERGRRSLLVGGAALFAVGILGHYLMTSVVLLVLLRAALGAAESLYFVAGFAALADLAPPGRAGQALSLNSLALYVGLALGPLVGQGLLRWGGFHLAWAGGAALAGLAVVAASRVPETRPAGDTVTARGAAAQALFHRSALVPGVALFSGVVVMSGFLAFAVLRARDVGIGAWSGVLLLFGCTVVVLRVVFAALPDRVPPLRLASAALMAAGAGSLLIGSIATPAGLLAGVVVLAAASAFLTPAIFAFVFSTVPAHERGRAAATTSIFIDLGLGAGPMLVGLVAAVTTVPVAFLIASALPVAGCCLLVATLISVPQQS